jgi:hypothetical protein
MRAEVGLAMAKKRQGLLQLMLPWNCSSPSRFARFLRQDRFHALVFFI